MPRRPRFQEPGAIYHVTSRGTEGRPVFLDDLDRRLFISVLAKVVQGREWTCPAYCLMTNHFHLLIQTPHPDLAVCRYIVLNPVRAGLCRRPGRWQWSSYRATAGYVSPPTFLAADWVLGQFAEDPRRAALRYVEFVAEGVDGRSGHVQGPGPVTWPNGGRGRT